MAQKGPLLRQDVASLVSHVVRQPPKNPTALSSFFRVRANPIRLTFNLLHPCSTMGEIQVDIYRQYR